MALLNNDLSDISIILAGRAEDHSLSGFWSGEIFAENCAQTQVSISAQFVLELGTSRARDFHGQPSYIIS